MATWHCFGLPNSGATCMGWLPLFFRMKCSLMATRNPATKPPRLIGCFLTTKTRGKYNGMIQKFPSPSGACWPPDFRNYQQHGLPFVRAM